MRVLILTSKRKGTASRCLPILHKNSAFKVVGVICAQGAGGNRVAQVRRKVRKILKIGLLGALNGIRMRKWYQGFAEDIEDVCQNCDVPFYEVSSLNGDETVALFERLRPQLGVSLGNGFISPRIFTLPELGMINMHSEILPAYQNAQSIIWPIFKNDPYTGFTVHEIVREIDAGKILYQKKIPITFCSCIEDTVRTTKAMVDAEIPAGVAYVCEHIVELKARARPQTGGARYTTPSIFQFVRMVLNNRKFYQLRSCAHE